MDKKAIRLDLYKQVLMDAPEVPEVVKSHIIPGAESDLLDKIVEKYNVPIHERLESPHFKEEMGMPEVRKQIIKDYQESQAVNSALSNLTQKKYFELSKLMWLVKEATIRKDASYLRALFSNIQNLLAPWLWNTSIGEALRLIQSALDEADRVEREKSKAWALPSAERQKVMKEHPEWFR